MPFDRSSRARAWITIAILAMLGCTSATDENDTTIDLIGSWTYAATQSGSSVRIDGTLVIDEQNGASFTGEFTGHLRDAQGEITNIDGIASGRSFGDDAIDFDLILAGLERRHVGRLARPDSIDGTWAQQNGNSTSGAFTLTRP